MANINVVEVGSSAGAAETAAAVNSSDTILNAKGARLRVINGGGSSINVTFVCASNHACQYGSHTPTHDVVNAVAAGATEVQDVPDRAINSAGNAVVNYSATTSVTAVAER
jgi:hypothetical protein